MGPELTGSHVIGLERGSSTIYHGEVGHEPRFQPTTRRVLAGGRRALGLMASGATCVQRLDGSRDSAIHTKYRISLRSSSMQEPRYPLPRVIVCKCCVVTTPRDTVSGPPGVALNRFEFLGARSAGVVFVARTRRPGARGAVVIPSLPTVQWTSHNVAGSEPLTSPQSEHFTGPFNR
ncbi:hypothetical protein JHK84_035397 [Glycine max]|nr:hypothetical protein JHK84_035397 [Glycine max]